AVAAVGFVIVGAGMGPVFPSIQHMAPTNFGREHSAAVIGLQMTAAYVGSTFMPMVFGLIQQRIGIGIMPFYLILFLLMNFGFLEHTYRKIA
ncbi:MAG: MFS transporter, partial [Oscillospiraceae bacterium]|nr:MFS transporter [Oscillospiraceae bacterium]